MALSPEQVAQILVQAGWTPADDPVTMLAIGGRESKYSPTAHRTDNPNPAAQTGDFGLFQINSGNFEFLRQNLGITQMNDLLDPVMNAKAALLLKRKSGWAPWAAAKGGFNASGDPLYGTNVAAAQTAWDNAQHQGLLGQNWSGGPVGTISGAPGAIAPASTFRPPSDAKIINVVGTYDVYALFDLGGVTISYKVGGGGPMDISGLPVDKVSAADWQTMAAVDGGDAAELGAVGSTYGSYKSFWDSIVGQVMGYNNPAKDDPEVRRVLAEFAARPDMAPAELTNRLQATAWWKTKTTSQLEWNGLPDAEKQKRRDEMGANMAQTWAQYTGQPVSANDPMIANYVEKLASGEMGMGAWTESVVKKAAMAVANSPYNRDLASEQKAEKQPGIDVENTAMRIRQSLEKWGVQWSEATVQDWAHKITTNDASDDDLLTAMKDQAQAQYGQWKPRDMETATYAAPWVETYNRVMETQGNLSTPQVQAALVGGKPVWEFEQNLKKSDGWLNTKNAREQLTTQIGSVGKLMGYF